MLEPSDLACDICLLPVNYRRLRDPTREAKVLAGRRHPSGKRKLANRARYARRGGKALRFDGAHRRRLK